MTDDTTVEVTCPRCSHVWTVDLAELDKEDQTIYKAANPSAKTEIYRARCSRCGSYAILEIEDEE